MINSQTVPITDENTKRWVVVLNKKIAVGKLMNALGHMMAGLMGNYPDPSEMKFLNYVDKDGDIHPNISHYPVIVLKADNSNQIKTLRDKVKGLELPFTDFTETMTVGSSAEQLAATKALKTEEHSYFGICFWGETGQLKPLIKKYSLFQ